MINKRQFLQLIASGSFRELFVSELGWNRFRGQAQLPTIAVDQVDYNFTAIAERSGFQILVTEVDAVPVNSVCRKIDSKLRRQANDYIAIYRLRDTEHHLWVVPVRANEKRDLVLVEYECADKADLLFSKVDGFSFNLGEDTNIVDLRAKVQGAFAINAEKITKDFYAGFKKEHKAFANFINGIEGTATADRDKQWYASVMLNRLMFCYFIQKKGFLNFEFDYLRRRFDEHVKGESEGTFFRSFYLDFLRSLFEDGLNDPVRTREFIQRYGKIPYLNGGMFEAHQLEKEYEGIDIADEAFDRLFAFFDKWNWHLDTRITASGKDINPDVLGYIFEQYINDRAQMGAYYTKEDITEYIGRNCILPFLFDKVKSSTREAAKDFLTDGYVWQTLRASGDRYIFDAVKKGFRLNDSIPENIQRGIITPGMRKEYCETPVGNLPDEHIPLAELRSDWNKPTPEPWGLPTEIWRETIERIERCRTLIAKIERGEITDINDFITYNLDIRSFAQDLLANTQDHLFVKHFYEALQGVTVLDPTCGSGAFLFAALNILEPLYETCIIRMQEFNEQNPRLFEKELAEITAKYRSNIQYFIYKSIILRNLYGVDIMVEATEIAKLRLFLKMVAVVEVDRRADNLGLDPLPDIDFNIRCGNTLVGYANEQELNRDLEIASDFMQLLANQEFKDKIAEEMDKVSKTYELFRSVQLTQAEDMAAFKQAKKDLRERLAKLNDTLNRRLFTATQSDSRDPSTTKEDLFASALYRDWLKSHQPFHWLAEFYDILRDEKDENGNITSKGGFDVIIGNPPYVEIRVASRDYRLSNYKTIDCGNLYACVFERSLSISRRQGYNIGMIVQLPIACTDRMSSAQKLLAQGCSWINTFDDRPGKLFDDLEHIRSTIFITRGCDSQKIHTSRYNRWYSQVRPTLFQQVHTRECYAIQGIDSFPKIDSSIGSSIISKIISKDKISRYFGTTKQFGVFFHNAPQYFTRCTNFQPHFWNQKDGEKLSVSIKCIYGRNQDERNVLNNILNCGIFYYWFILLSDCRHLNMREIENFHLSINDFNDKEKQIHNFLSSKLMKDYEKNRNRKSTFYKTTGKVEYDEYFPKLSKPIIDEIDKVLAKHYGFTDEELDFIINYDIKYRMGDELKADE